MKTKEPGEEEASPCEEVDGSQTPDGKIGEENR